jgi:hypothetical protein
MLIGVAFIAAIIGLAVWVRVAHVKKKKALRLAFESKGFTPNKDVPQPVIEIASKALLPDGMRCRYFHDWYAQGSIDGVDVTLILHRTLRRVGKSYETVFTMIAAIESPKAWPGLRLQAETLLTRAAAKVGMKDLQVESKPFNKRWHITADDKEFAVLVLSPELQEWLLEAPKKESWTILGGHLVCAWQKPLKLNEVDLFLGRVATFKRMLPQELDEWTPAAATADTTPDA